MSDSYNNSPVLNLKWIGASMLIFFVVQLVLSIAFGIFGILTLGIGFLLFIIIKPIVYFVGGFITGILSPGVTIKEPAIGAVAITVLGGIFDAGILLQGRMIGTILASILAFIVALVGATIGENMTGSRNQY